MMQQATLKKSYMMQRDGRFRMAKPERCATLPVIDVHGSAALRRG